MIEKSKEQGWCRYSPLIPRALIILAGAILLLIGCSKKKPQQVIPPRPVKIATAIEKDVPLSIQSFGNLVSPGDVNIISQVTGKIKEVHFEEGDNVKKGQLLFLIDPREYRANLDKSRAALMADQVDSKLKKETFERNKKLIGQKLISQQDYDTYETEAAAAEAQVSLDQANVKLAEINLDYCSIKSPIDGVAGRRQVDPGNIVTANSGPTLVNIRTVDPLYVDFPTPERKLSWVREYMARSALKVGLKPAGDDRGPYQGKLQMIENTVDPTTGAIILRATVDNKERALWPGQYLTVKLEVETAQNAVLVPGSAVQLGRTGPYIFVVTDDNKAQLREDITVGDDIAEDLIIRKGVKAGEKVVTYGQMGLVDGAPVTIISGSDGTEWSGGNKENAAEQKGAPKQESDTSKKTESSGDSKKESGSK